jgi:hypothetical protein
VEQALNRFDMGRAEPEQIHFDKELAVPAPNRWPTHFDTEQAEPEQIHFDKELAVPALNRWPS